MTDVMHFCGASGISYRFERVRGDGWPRRAGVLIFAAPEGVSARAIAIADQGGEADEINVFWRWREARRFGATLVMFRPDPSLASRRDAARDLCLGLDPPVRSDRSESSRIAA